MSTNRLTLLVISVFLGHTGCSSGGDGTPAAAGEGADPMSPEVGAGAPTSNEPPNGESPPVENEPKAPTPGAEFVCPSGVVPGPVVNQVRRLTKAEYQNSVLDVLGVDASSLVAELPDGRPTTGEFNNQGRGATRAHIDQFAAMAENIAAQVPASTWADCAEYTEACRGRFYDSLGLRLFRAPLSTEERAALDKVFAAGETNGAVFDEAARAVLEAMLQSPRFIYRVENQVGDGTVQPVGPYELASRMSFALWQSSPDLPLLEAAADGSLLTDAGFEQQQARLLEHPRALSAGRAFLDDWMDLHRSEEPELILAKHPDFDQRLVADMREETHAAFDFVYNNERPFMDIHNLQFSTLTPALASFYKLTDAKTEPAEYNLEAVPERGGLLTHASMGSLGGSESSTVRRGLHLLYEVMCSTMANPPAGTEVVPTPAKPGESVRQSSQGRVDNPACGACHRQFEPLVWGLVRYDVSGAYSAQDEYGNDLPEDGFVVFPGNPERVEFSNVRELTDALASAPRVRDCALLKVSEYYFARSPVQEDCASLAAARTEVETGTGTFPELVSAVVSSPNFRNKKTEVAVEGEAP